MASSHKRGKGWRVSVWEDGKQRWLPGSHRTKADADEEGARVQAILDAKRPAARLAQEPLATLIARWAADRVSQGNDPHWTELTAKRVRSLCEARGWALPRDVTPAAVVSWRSSGGKARLGAYLRAVLWWARDSLQQPVDEQTLIALRPPKAKRRPDKELLTPAQVAEVQAAADAVSPEAGALVHCLSTYGWRPVTAGRLTVGDVDLEEGTVDTKVKGGDVLRHPLLPATVERLRAAVGEREAGPLFRHPRTQVAFTLSGGSSVASWINTSLMRREIGSYQLKSYAITRMLDRGLTERDARDFTGHKTPGQLLRYARTNATRARKSLEKLG